jgi:hypothetical protein
MCEVQDVRYVHVMEHVNYAETLPVGCICAGRMEGDPVRARDREASFKALCGRRAKWLTREWCLSQRGNQYRNTDDFIVVVFPVYGGWSAKLTLREEDGESIRLSGFSTEEQAKLALLEAMIAHKERNKGSKAMERPRASA